MRERAAVIERVEEQLENVEFTIETVQLEPRMAEREGREVVLQKEKCIFETFSPPFEDFMDSVTIPSSS